MKKAIAMLTILVLILSAAALAGSAYTPCPESEAYTGTWYTDDFILEIAPSEVDENLFVCVITRYAEENRGVQWTYDTCSWDEVSNALTSPETGVKLDVTFDDDSEVADSVTVFEDGAAAFALNEDGTLTWTDFKETPDENEMVFRKVTGDIGNPVAAYEGRWVSDRAELVIEDLDDVVTCTVRWADSASEVTEWIYEGCLYDEITDGLTTFETGIKVKNTYNEQGEVAASEEIFNDGAASFVINEDGTLTWTDFKETPGENEITFERAEIDEEIN